MNTPKDMVNNAKAFLQLLGVTATNEEVCFCMIIVHVLQAAVQNVLDTSMAVALMACQIPVAQCKTRIYVFAEGGMLDCCTGV